VTLPILIVGAGCRAGIYASLLREQFSDRLRLVGVVSRSRDRAAALAEAEGVPWALEGDLEDAAHAWEAAGAVVCPSSEANARMARRVAAQGRPFLLETPPALEVPEAEALLAFVSAQGLAVEVAEQNPRGAEASHALDVVRSGRIGEVRMVACDLASYRYHATAVGRALLGKPRGRRAVALRARFPDLPEHAATITAGTIEAEGGRILQVRDGEGLYLEEGPWRSGGWSIYGSEGSLIGGRLTIGGVEEPVDTGWTEDDDRRAIGRCVDDWLARLGGRATETQWSLEDAVEDLRWIDALERSARLGGAPILL